MAPDRELPDRRAVLRIGGGVVALAIGVGAGIIDRRDRPDPPDPEPIDTPPPTTANTTTTTSTTTTTVAPVVPDAIPAGILAIGTAYLQATLGEADVTSLLARLPSPDGDVAAAARARLSADFAAGETVVIDGWVLAVSEARAAAVLALVCPDPC